MTYEMMRADLSCAYWIETRDIRRFDSHNGRRGLWEADRVTADAASRANRSLAGPTLGPASDTYPWTCSKYAAQDDSPPDLGIHDIVLTSEFGLPAPSTVTWTAFGRRTSANRKNKRRLTIRISPSTGRSTYGRVPRPTGQGRHAVRKVGEKTLCSRSRFCPTAA